MYIIEASNRVIELQRIANELIDVDFYLPANVVYFTTDKSEYLCRMSQIDLKTGSVKLKFYRGSGGYVTHISDVDTITRYFNFEIDLFSLYEETKKIYEDLKYLKSYLFMVPKNVITYSNSEEMLVCYFKDVNLFFKQIDIVYFVNDNDGYIQGSIKIDDFINYKVDY